MHTDNQTQHGLHIQSHKELRVYRNAMQVAMQVFHISKTFPPEEKYSLTDQIRRSSRSVCVNLAEAWRKRRYKAAFIAKLNDAEGEACETQSWVEIAYHCGYLDPVKTQDLDYSYHQILAQIVRMIDNSEKWVIPRQI